MSQNKFKIAFVFLFYSLALIWDGCSTTPDCNCPEINFEFVDYIGFEAAINNSEIDTSTSPVFEILLQPDSVHFIAQCSSPGLGLMSKAYGCSCLPEGFRGDKFPILAIDIFANQPFKEEYIAETNLNHIFQIGAINDLGVFEFQPINEVNQFPKIFEFDSQLLIRTEEIPDSTGMDISYSFDIVVTKSNGTVLTVTTEEVRWF